MTRFNYSQNKIYAVISIETPNTVIPDKELEYIFIRNDHSNPYPFLQKSKDHSLPGYTCFVYKTKTEFINDCLQFAESMVSGEVGYSDTKCIMKERKTKLVFGFTRQQNERIARIARETSPEDINERANPHVGESYVIVLNVDDPDNVVQFHAAAVVFEDGDDRITLEANTYWEDRLKRPQFCIYSVSRHNKTFHAVNEKDFKPATTLVLTSRMKKTLKTFKSLKSERRTRKKNYIV